MIGTGCNVVLDDLIAMLLGSGRDQCVRELGVRHPVQQGLHRQLPDVQDPPRVQDSLLAEGEQMKKSWIIYKPWILSS